MQAMAPMQLEREESKSDYKSRRASSNAEFNAAITGWKKSDEGDYIEFIIEFSFIGGGKKWKLNKRYSDFVYAHNKILNSPEKDIPKLPPKIENRNPEQLEMRRFQLEEYLNAYLDKYPINPIILEFCEFSNEGSQVFRELSHMYIKNCEFSIPGKYYKLTETRSVDTFYEAYVKIYNGDDTPKEIKISLTYETLKQFQAELRLIARMGDVDIAKIGDIPYSTNVKGEKLLDQEMRSNIEEYLNRFQHNCSLLNLIIFKKLLSDNIILESNNSDNKRRQNEAAGLRLMGSIKDEETLFRHEANETTGLVDPTLSPNLIGSTKKDYNFFDDMNRPRGNSESDEEFF